MRTPSISADRSKTIANQVSALAMKPSLLGSFKLSEEVVEFLCVLGQLVGYTFKLIRGILVCRRTRHTVAFDSDLAEALCNLPGHNEIF